MRTMIVIAALAALAACSQETTTTAPDTTMAPPAVEPAPTVIVLTQADAQTRAEAAGYTAITGLVQNPDGSWSATGTQNGAATQITISDTGVTLATAMPPATP